MKKKPSNMLRPKPERPLTLTHHSVEQASKEPTTPGDVQPSHLRHFMMPQHCQNLLAFLNEDRTRQKFCDVSVSVGGKVYSAHRAVLAHGSSYFHAELTKSPAAVMHITLDHVEDSVFQHLLGFLYTAECVVEEMDVPALAEAARFLDMMDILKLLCENRETHSPEAETRADTEQQPSFCKHDHVSETSGVGHETQKERSTTTRRSTRRKRMPTKYWKDDLHSNITAEEEHQMSLSPPGQDNNRVGEAAEVISNVDMNQTSTQVTQRNNAMEDDGGEDERADCNTGVAAQENLTEAPAQRGTAEQAGSYSDAAEHHLDQDVDHHNSAVEGRSPAYPEGLAPFIIQTSTRRILQCPKCDKTFDRAGKYESHTRVHTGEKPFQCEVCLQRYSTKSNLTVHKKKHTSDAPLPKKDHKCPFCNKLHASKKTLAKHVRRFHPDQNVEFFAPRKKKSEGWKCVICSKTFSRRPHLQEHMILHSQDRPFKCSFCDEHFRSRFARLKHHEKYHLGPFPCEICGRQFNDTGNKKRHMECTHGGMRKWTCYVCGKSVRERTTLKEHLRIHSGEKPHLCSICGQSFRHSSSYRLHLRVHHDDKRYECEECGKSFIRHDHLTKHQKIHSGEKAHQCEECGKCFRRHDHLTAHYKSVHLGEKIWQKYKTAVHQCEICKKEFKGKSSLEMHFRTHSGEKPHRCPECNQTFRIKKTLTKHMVIHSDERPFNCSQCSATFKRKDKLKYHVDHVHSARVAKPPPDDDKPFSVYLEESSKMFHSVARGATESPSSPSDICVPITVIPVIVGAQTDLRSQSHRVISIQAQGQPQSSAYQAATDLAFFDKYTLSPQAANMAQPVRAEQILDPPEQSYLGTLLGLDSAASVQTISSSDHAH